jgi:serine/threonine protein phosphatase PrpC
MNIISHTGIGKRNENQDLILISELQNDMSLYLVVDGMGGYENGFEAAKIIIENIDSYLKTCKELKSKDIDIALKKANLAIKQFNEANSSKSGATLGGLIRSREKSLIFWLGDVIICLFEGETISYKSKAHSLINSLVESGKVLTADKIDKYKHIVTKSISGKREIIEKGFFEISNNAYDKFLICSDGVTDTILLNDFVIVNVNDLNVVLKNKSKDNYSYILGEKEAIR